MAGLLAERARAMPTPKTRKNFYSILEKEIVPLYYGKDEAGIPHGWVRVMKESIKSTAPAFSSEEWPRTMR